MSNTIIRTSGKPVAVVGDTVPPASDASADSR